MEITRYLLIETTCFCVSQAKTLWYLPDASIYDVVLVTLLKYWKSNYGMHRLTQSL